MSTSSNRYLGRAAGFHDTVTAVLTITDQNITKTEASYQTDTVGSLAIDRMKDQILVENSVQLDAISGATYSSTAYRTAAQKAYAVYLGELTPEQAAEPQTASPLAEETVDSMTSSSVQPPSSQPENTSCATAPLYVQPDTQFDASYDLVVVGGGGAGLAAAAQASSAGLSILLCEKAGIVGGSTAYSGGVMQAAGTKYQPDPTDTPDKHAQYWLKAGEENVDEQLVCDLAHGAPENIDWLADLGLKWETVYGNCQIPYISPDLFADRIHVYQGGGTAGNGTVLVEALLSKARQHHTTFWYDAPVISLIKDLKQQRIAGVVVNKQGVKHNVRATKGVLLATASVDQNPALAYQLNRQHYDDLLHKTCLSAKSDTGDGIIMGMSVGAAITGMGGCIDFDGVTGNATDNRVPTIPLIFVNGAGQRFVCEDATYAYQYRAIFNQEKQFDQPTYMVFGADSLAWPGSPWTEATLAQAVQDGQIIAAGTLKELAQRINVPYPQLRDSVDDWNLAMVHGADPLFGRKTGLGKIQGTYYAMPNKATNLGAIGGLKINTDCQVIDNFDQPISGLYAAGLNAGGWLGPYYPGSGTAVAGIIHQGRKAAKHLAQL